MFVLVQISKIHLVRPIKDFFCSIYYFCEILSSQFLWFAFGVNFSPPHFLFVYSVFFLFDFILLILKEKILLKVNWKVPCSLKSNLLFVLNGVFWNSLRPLLHSERNSLYLIEFVHVLLSNFNVYDCKLLKRK